MSRRPAAERFWENVDRSAGPDACWPWTGAVDSSGYGSFSGAGFRRAHRFAFWIATGIVPGALHVMHRCDNPPCVNYRHLRLGSNADNTADKMVKGRNQRGTRVNTNKLTERDVIAMRYLRSTGATTPDLARAFGVCQSQAHNVVAGNNWQWLPKYEAIPLAEKEPAS